MAFSLVVLAVLIAAVGCKRKSANSTAITILYNAEEQPAEKSAVAQIIQSQLISHGINAKLEPVSNSIYYDRIGKGDFDATLALWYLDYNDPEGFLTDFYSKASFRMAKYNNP
jgi:ABC-type transport system substrate-binding protein